MKREIIWTVCVQYTFTVYQKQCKDINDYLAFCSTVQHIILILYNVIRSDSRQLMAVFNVQ
jgi:hypothetical protein